MLLLELFNKLEDGANCFVLAFDTKPHIVSVVLNHLNVHELVAKRLNNAEQGSLYKDVLCDVIKGE